MIDLKKIAFKHQLSSVIMEHPEWVDAAIEAVQDGIKQSIEKWRDDQCKMACLLLLFYLKDKTGFQIEKEDKRRTLEYLKKYFDMKTFSEEAALPFVQNMKR